MNHRVLQAYNELGDVVLRRPLGEYETREEAAHKVLAELEFVTKVVIGGVHTEYIQERGQIWRIESSNLEDMI